MTKPHREELFQVTLKNNRMIGPSGIDAEAKALWEKNSYTVFSNCFVRGNVNMIIPRFFCMFCEEYQISNYVRFSAELKGCTNIKLTRLNGDFIGLDLSYNCIMLYFFVLNIVFIYLFIFYLRKIHYFLPCPLKRLETMPSPFATIQLYPECCL